MSDEIDLEKVVRKFHSDGEQILSVVIESIMNCRVWRTDGFGDASFSLCTSQDTPQLVMPTSRHEHRYRFRTARAGFWQPHGAEPLFEVAWR